MQWAHYLLWVLLGLAFYGVGYFRGYSAGLSFGVRQTVQTLLERGAFAAEWVKKMELKAGLRFD